MKNRFGVEIKGIEQHFMCGHRTAFMEPLPNLTQKHIERVVLGQDGVYRFSDFSAGQCAMCTMNEKAEAIG